MAFSYQVGAVVHRHRDHALGQVAVDLDQLGGDRLGHRAAVLANQHEHRAQHHFPAVFGGRARAQLFAQADLGNMADADWRAIDTGDDDIGDVLGRRHLAWRANQQLLAIALDVAGADVGVVALQRRDQVVEGEFVGRQALGLRRNQVLLGMAANAVDPRATPGTLRNCGLMIQS
ncbi:hypothetical protein PPS11_36920 [Pseudomonas putida S11]|nr:hypothetical protein PPS11_36920 [Pseudomonas putida S11]